jgi:hypothetical protein
MPIQITELNISVSVNQPDKRENLAQQEQDSQDHSANENMVEECVEQIMKILNDKKER